MVIIYKSKYGATKKYATWLSERINGDLIEYAQTEQVNLENYDSIVIAGGIHASGIAGVDFLKKNYEKIKDKKIAVFANGAGIYNEEELKKLKDDNLKELSDKIPLFYGRGIFDVANMNFFDRTVCKMINKSNLKKGEASVDPKMWNYINGGTDCDWSDSAYLEPLIAYLNS